MPSTHLTLLRRVGATTLIACLAGFLFGPGAALGASNGQVEVARHSCATPQAGRVSCDAEVMVYKTSHRLVHPAVKAIRSSVERSAHTTLAPATSHGVGAPATMTPAYLQQAYDLTALAGSAGAGDTVAVTDVGNDPAAASDLATFRATYGLPACTVASGCLTVLNEYGATSPLPSVASGWVAEESLDLDAVSSICPRCRIVLVEAAGDDINDLETAMRSAAAAGADQISNSWSTYASSDPFAGFSLPGVSLVAATGDLGIDTVGEDSYPAADPAFTAVGGTTLTSGAAGVAGARGLRETAWSGAGAGCDTAVAAPAYQPASACAGRLYADLSADADPASGLNIYDSADGGWEQTGGTSLAAPIVAAAEALMGIRDSSAGWLYSDAAALNTVTGSCSGAGQVLCDDAGSYRGQAGLGSVSGALVNGAPGIGLPSYGASASNSYVAASSATGVTLRGGIYPNGEQTSYYWQYGTTSAYGSQNASGSLAAGTTASLVSGRLTGLRAGAVYHYRLVASNASGTTYGYDYSFTAPRASAATSRVVAARHTAATRRAAAARRRAAAARRAAAVRRARQRAREQAAAKAKAARAGKRGLHI